MSFYRRVFDIVASASLLLICLPVIAVATIGSAVALRSWPFFTQQRVGLDGRTFRFLKVRTLPPSVPAYTDKHQLTGYEIPAFCGTLRRLHLDELPQLFLVLTGRMSLVGPRPEMPHLHEMMPATFARQRTSVRPGCTGLWQISTGCGDLIGSNPEFDLYYLANRTVRLDLWILAQTALKMLASSRRISLDEVPRWVLPAADLAQARLIDLRVDSTINLDAGRLEGAQIAAELS